jgi:hypothetical protein
VQPDHVVLAEEAHFSRLNMADEAAEEEETITAEASLLVRPHEIQALATGINCSAI